MLLKYNPWSLSELNVVDASERFKIMLARFALERAEARHLNVSTPDALKVDTDQIRPLSKTAFEVFVHYAGFVYIIHVDVIDGGLSVDDEKSAPTADPIALVDFLANLTKR